jgi:transcriptional regulator with XRE-family HTH domain
MRIGKILRQYRLLRELTHEELAEEIGISRASVLRIEAGKDVGSDKIATLIYWLFHSEKDAQP